MTRIGALACALLAALVASAAPAAGQHRDRMPHGHSAASGVEAAYGWARAAPGAARAGAAYVTLHNPGDAEDRLTGAETPVAGHAGLHTHVMDGTVMRMRPVEGGLAVAPGETVEFKPGGYHIMLTGLKKPLKEGDTFPLTLIFEKSGRKTVEIAVLGLGAMGPDGGHGTEHGTSHGGH